MIKTLSLILLILLILISKKQGIKIFLCFYLNYGLIITYIFLVVHGFHTIILSLLMCAAASALSLFFLNGINIKTKSAFQAISTVLCFMFVLIFFLGHSANIQGFSHEALETISLFAYDIHYNMTDLIIGLILVCTIGTTIDTSMSISTAVNEIYLNNKRMSTLALFKSGMTVGKDILSTTINTLFFVFLGGMIGFFIWHQHDSFSDIINYKSFVQEVIELLCCCIGSVLVIPVTSYITSIKLKQKNV